MPVGVGIHSGMPWVGSIAGASGAAADFTALGDNMNVAACLASKAAEGEVLISEATHEAAPIGLPAMKQLGFLCQASRDRTTLGRL